MSSAGSSNHEENVAQLCAMGFEKVQVEQALQMCNGNLENAANLILTGALPPTLSQPSTSVPPTQTTTTSTTAVLSSSTSRTSIITCPISQYNVENGRSACTCIALNGACMFLQNPNSLIISSSSFLQSMITTGVEKYQQLSSISSVEHLSAEEVLQQPAAASLFAGIQSLGIRQGLLSQHHHDSSNGMGLETIVQGIRSSEQKNDSEWLVILMTKTPETVFLCLPPKNNNNNDTTGNVDDNDNSLWWLVDSHPRPGISGAYAKGHSSLQDLCRSVQEIFPPTDLGPDIPEMMAMMYNSFDLYPLRKR